MAKLTTGLAAVLALAISVGASAADVSERGRAIAQGGNGKGAVACTACHGADGAGNAAAGFPRLAGMNAEYMAKQLADFTNGTRANPIMKPIAGALSAADTAAVSAYYAGLSASTAGQRPSVSPEVLARGKALAEVGDWSNDMPACTSCHGPGGRGVGAAFPGLAGQHASYITAQIKAWRDGTRRNDPIDLMKTVADRLSDADAAAVSAYFAGLGAE